MQANAEPQPVCPRFYDPTGIFTGYAAGIGKLYRIFAVEIKLLKQALSEIAEETLPNGV